MRDENRQQNRNAAVVAAVALGLVLASTGLALFVNTAVEGQPPDDRGDRGSGGDRGNGGDDDDDRDRDPLDDDLIKMEHALLDQGSGAMIKDAKLEDSYVDDVTLLRSSIEDSRIENSSIQFSKVEDGTLCDTTVTGGITVANNTTLINNTTLVTDGIHFANCTAVTVEDGEVEVHAVIEQDAPETIAPGESYDVRINGSDAEELTVFNDPGGLVGLGFETEFDPLRLHEHAFPAVADNDSIVTLQLWMPAADNATDDNLTDDNVTNGNVTNGNVTNGNVTNGNLTNGNVTNGNLTNGNVTNGNVTDNETGNATLLANFTFGETVELPDGPFVLRVITNNTSIIDGTRIGLLLELDDHAVRPEMTSFEVVATELVIPPVEEQLFAPFLADDVARLVLSVPVDDHGNVDRDVNISFAVTVNAVNVTDNVTFVGDLQDRARLHDDSRLFSEAPFSYLSEVDMAHHPQTLELLVSLNLDDEIGYGDIDAYGTHLVAIGPYETNVTLDASATNATGGSLSASLDILMGATPDDEHEAEAFGEDFELPGTGELNVAFVNETGESVASGEDWTLFIQETPDSHGVAQTIAVANNSTFVRQDLAASAQVGTPFGNFVPSAYMVCVDHGVTRDCASGPLVEIETGETTSVEIEIS